MIDSGRTEVETMQGQGQGRRPLTIDEIIEKAKHGLIDDSMATRLLSELEQAETRPQPGPDEPAHERRRASA